MRYFSCVLALALSLPCTLDAQTTVEIGTGLGAAVAFEGERSTTTIGVAGGSAGFYATVLTGSGTIIQPEVAYNLVAIGDFGSGSSLLKFILHSGRTLHGTSRNSAYVTFNGGLQWYYDSPRYNQTTWGLGGQVGYRILVSHGFVMRMEGGYRRWFGESGYNEVSSAVRIGAVVKSPRWQ